MTDNDIIKAVACCRKEDCENCPYFASGLFECGEHFNEDVLNLIYRQKAEIEALFAGQETLERHIIYAKPVVWGKSTMHVECTNAEHLKKHCSDHESSKIRPKNTHACKNYVERSDTE